MSKRGYAIPSITRNIELMHMVMCQGATWDFHRYHYDTEFVQQKGFAKPFLDGQMLDAYLGHFLTGWAGVDGTIKKLGFRFYQLSVPRGCAHVHGTGDS